MLDFWSNIYKRFCEYLPLCFLSTYLMMTPRVFYRIFFGHQFGDIVAAGVFLGLVFYFFKRGFFFKKGIIIFGLYLLVTLFYMSREFGNWKILVQIYFPIMLIYLAFLSSFPREYLEKMFKISLVLHLSVILLPLNIFINGLDENTLFGFSSLLKERETGFYEAPAMLGMYAMLGLALFSYRYIKYSQRPDLIWGVLFAYCGFATMNRSFLIAYIIFCCSLLFIFRKYLAKTITIIILSGCAVLLIQLKREGGVSYNYVSLMTDRFSGKDFSYGVSVRINGEAGSLRCLSHFRDNPLLPTFHYDERFHRLRLLDSSGYFDCSNGLVAILAKRGAVCGLLFVFLWFVVFWPQLKERKFSRLVILFFLMIGALSMVDPLLDMAVVFLVILFGGLEQNSEAKYLWGPLRYSLKIR